MGKLVFAYFIFLCIIHCLKMIRTRDKIERAFDEILFAMHSIILILFMK